MGQTSLDGSERYQWADRRPGVLVRPLPLCGAALTNAPPFMRCPVFCQPLSPPPAPSPPAKVPQPLSESFSPQSLKPRPRKPPPLDLPPLGHLSWTPLKIPGFCPREAARGGRRLSPLISLFCQGPSVAKPLSMPI